MQVFYIIFVIIGVSSFLLFCAISSAIIVAKSALSFIQNKVTFRKEKFPWSIFKTHALICVMSTLFFISFCEKLISPIFIVFFSYCDTTPIVVAAVEKGIAVNCFDYWVRSYQTMITGILAVIVAIFTYLLYRAQHTWERRQAAKREAEARRI